MPACKNCGYNTSWAVKCPNCDNDPSSSWKPSSTNKRILLAAKQTKKMTSFDIKEKSAAKLILPFLMDNG